MKRFKFSLQKILNLRKFREEECKIALGQAVSALNKIENDIRETALRKQDAASQRFTDSANIYSWNNYILRLDQLTEQLTEEAAKAELVVEEKRALYIEASSELKALEKLKEKREKEYRKEMLNQEMAEVDEMVGARRFLTIS